MTLAPTLAFDCPTLDAMADYLLGVIAPANRPATTSSAPPPAAPAIDVDVAQVGMMSQEEVRALLAGELAALSLDGIGEDQG
jgi:hypothetical protein